MLKKNKVIKIFAILIVMAISMCVLTGCGEDNKESSSKSSKKNDTEIVESMGNDIEQPIKYMVEGLVETNSSKFIKAFPPFISSSMGELFDDETLKNALESSTSEYGENIKMSYEVTGKEELDQSKLEEMEKTVKESYNQTVDITKGYELEVKITTKGDKAEDSETDIFEVYQIDGAYYILNI